MLALVRPALTRWARLVALSSLVAAAPHAARAQFVRDSAAGASRTVLVVDSIDLSAISTLSELLQARVPGTVVQSPSGSVGAGASVTSRGLKSVFVLAEPLLVVDGVRAVGTSRSFVLDSALTISRLDDLPLAWVERVEVLRGPAAAARYGPGAAQGAILVTTRSGTPGRRRVRAYAQGGGGYDATEYPRFATGVGRTRSGGTARPCTLATQATGSCTLTAIETADLFAAVPRQTATHARAGVSVERGGTRATYASALDGGAERGILRGNDANRLAARAAATFRPASRFEARVALSGLRRETALVPGDQATPLVTSILPYRSAGTRVDLPATRPAMQVATRGDASLTARWTPAPWLAAYAIGGISDVSFTESRRQTTSGASNVDLPGAPAASFVYEGRGVGHDWTASGEVGSALTARAGALTATTTLALERLGVRRTRTRTDRAYAASDPGFADEQFSRRQATFSTWSPRLAQRVALGDRLVVDGVVRRNALHELGVTHSVDVDASTSAVWTALRGANGRGVALRGAYGLSSTPAGELFLDLLLTRTCLLCGTNESLRRERTREAELGVEVALGTLGTVRVTAFQQRTRNVVVNSTPQGGLGSSGASLYYGTVHNDGVEVEWRGDVVDRPAVGLAFGARAATLRNGLRDYAGSPRIYTNQIIADGEPLGGFRTRPVTVADANGDGIVVQSEISLDQPETLATRGGPSPSRTAALDGRLRLGRRLTVAALAEYRGGHLLYGGRPDLYASAAPECYDRTAAPPAQAACVDFLVRAVALAERADFARLRELTVSYRLVGGGGAPTLTLAGRNLATITSFSGTDPEANAAPSQPFRTLGYFTQPLPATLSLRLTTSW